MILEIRQTLGWGLTRTGLKTNRQRGGDGLMMRKPLIVWGAILLLFLYGIYHFQFAMYSLPEGELIYESTSPQNIYVVKLYRSSPALSSDGIRGEVISTKTGRKRNLYWEYDRYLYERGIEDSVISWDSDQIVIINGERLDVTKDTYDYRRKQ